MSRILGWLLLVFASYSVTAGENKPVTLKLRDLNGDKVTLSDYRGRPVVVNFWATWCDVCTKEMKYFVRAQQQFGDKVAVVTVSNELPDVAASYFRTWNIGLPLVEDLDGAISRIYSIAKLPDTLVLDPFGRVSYVSVGGLSWDELQSAIDRAAQTSSR